MHYTECPYGDQVPWNNTKLNCYIILLQKGLKNVFDEAILAALEPPEPQKKKKCVLL